MVIREYSKVELVFSSSESEAVKIALVSESAARFNSYT